MAKSTLPMTEINKAIAQLKGPYDYKQTGEFLDKLSDKTQEELYRPKTTNTVKNIIEKREKAISCLSR
ncbi:MAG: hypothetical protein VB084_11140 [Syntrophomonadaceae bacterium]|nr:hypothetical protein [Syntrophomonadaceae bacterium]